MGVIFASVPNFNEFYTEMDGSDQGLECLRLLNEIIADFDELLKEDRFRGIDKIKTVGSTYMAVVGLIPEYKIQPNDPNSVRRHMTALVEYVKAMRLSLQEINSHSYNNFMLRVGGYSNTSTICSRPLSLIVFPFPHRHQYWSRCGGRDWSPEAAVRYLGQHGECGESHGLDRGARLLAGHPGGGGQLGWLAL